MLNINSITAGNLHCCGGGRGQLGERGRGTKGGVEGRTVEERGRMEENGKNVKRKKDAEDL